MPDLPKAAPQARTSVAESEIQTDGSLRLGCRPINQNLPNKGDNPLNIINILHAFYGDFDFVEEQWNQDYEGLLLTTGEGRKYIRCRLAKKTPKKEGYFTVFLKKDRNNKNIPYGDEDPGDELAIAVIDGGNSGLFIIPKAAAVNKKTLSTKDGKGKMAMRFYPPWCANLNKTAQSAQKWQLEYFQSHPDKSQAPKI